MCWLIISLPVYGSSAYAITIENVKITGSDGKEGYVKPMDDTLNIEATISEPIQPTEIFVDISALGVVNDIFGSCNGKVCVYSHAISSIDSKKHSLSVKVNTESGDSNSKDADFCADGLGPTVKVKAAGQDKGNLVVQFTATDKAPSNCAGLGIKDAMLFLNGEQFKAMEPFAGDKSTEDGTFVIDKSELSEEILNDAIDACVEATDALGNSGKGCKTTASKFDFTPPDILEETIVVTDENGNVIKYVAGAKEEQTDVFTKINVKVNISEEDLKVSTASSGTGTTSATYADFSKLTTKSEKKTQYEKKAPDSCTKEDTINNIYVCEWKGIEYNGKIEVLNVKFHAEDKAGNKDEIEQTLPVERYSGNPVIGRIFIVGKEDQDPIYLAGNKQYDIGVEISDPVGFNNDKQLFIKLSGFTVPQLTLSNPCEETTSGVWVCYFNNTKAKKTDGKGSIEVLSNSENDINKIIDLETSVKILEVVIDSSTPSIVKFSEDTEFNSVKYNKNDEAVFSSTDCPTGESGYDLTYIVTDKNKPTIIAESGAISYNELTTGSCVEADSGDYPFVPDVYSMGLTPEQVKQQGVPLPFECTISIPNILPVTGKGIEFDVNITDPAGNVYTHKQKTDLCAEDLSKTPEFVDGISVDESKIPSLDKKTISLIDYPFLMELTYNLDENTIVLSQTITCDVANIEFIGGDNKVDDDTKVKEATATIKKITISADNPNLDWDEEGNLLTNILPVSCKATMIIRKNSKNYIIPEEEEFKFNLQLSGFAMGEASTAIKKQIKALDEERENVETWAEGIETVVLILEVFCNLAELIGTVNSIIQAIKTAVYGVLVVIGSVPVLKPFAEGAWKLMCVPMDSFHTFVTYWIWPPGVLPIPYMPGYIFKYICMYLQCTWARPDVVGKFLGTLGDFYISKSFFPAEGFYSETLFDAYPMEGSISYSAATEDMVNIMRAPWGIWGTGGTLGHFGEGINQPDDPELNKWSKKWNGYDKDELADEVGEMWDDPKSFDPFRIEAISWWCPKAQIYTAKKQRQIVCAKQVCYLNSIKYGLSPAPCDKLRSIHECLYIKSAFATLLGDTVFDDWLAMVIWYTFIEMIIRFVTAEVSKYFCAPYYTPSVITGVIFCKGLLFSNDAWQSVACGTGMAAMSIMEMYDFIVNDDFEEKLNFYDVQTKDIHDYCKDADALKSEVEI